MKGCEALKALEDGKGVRSRKYQGECFEYFYFKMNADIVGSLYIKDFESQKRGDIGWHCLSIIALISYDDWEIYEDAVEQKNFIDVKDIPQPIIEYMEFMNKRVLELEIKAGIMPKDSITGNELRKLLGGV